MRHERREDEQQCLTYTVAEAAEILGIGRTTAYECIRTGELPALRFGSRIVIARSVVDTMLQEHSVLDTKPA